MRIGLGATVLARGLEHHQLDGIGYYTQELGRGLSELGCDWRPMVFGRTTQALIDQRAIGHLPRYSTSALKSALTGCSLTGSARLREQLDLFHATDHHIPRIKGLPVLATLMDAIPLAHPEWANASLRTLKNKLWRAAAHWADHVVTISDYSKTQIMENFGLESHRISVVPLGVDGRYQARLEPELLARVHKAHGLSRPYYLCIGTLQPRKNTERVIDAYQRLPAAIAQTHDLVIVGRHGWGSDALVQRLQAMPKEGHIKWLGSVSDLDKRALLQGACALVFPSLSEGFGLPVLEGFASQTPVITSNSTSLPEVAADAALLINPLDVDAIAQAMQSLVEQSDLAEVLRQKGLARTRLFTWEACARKTMRLYQTLLGDTA